MRLQHSEIMQNQRAPVSPDEMFGQPAPALPAPPEPAPDVYGTPERRTWLSEHQGRGIYPDPIGDESYIGVAPRRTPPPGGGPNLDAPYQHPDETPWEVRRRQRITGGLVPPQADPREIPPWQGPTLMPETVSSRHEDAESQRRRGEGISDLPSNISANLKTWATDPVSHLKTLHPFLTYAGRGRDGEPRHQPGPVGESALELPAALRLTSSLLAPPGPVGAAAGAGSEVIAQGLEKVVPRLFPQDTIPGITPRAEFNPRDVLAKSLFDAVGIPGKVLKRGKPWQTGAFGAGAGAVATGIEPVLEGRVPTPEEVGPGIVAGGVLGGAFARYMQKYPGGRPPGTGRDEPPGVLLTDDPEPLNRLRALQPLLDAEEGPRLAQWIRQRGGLNMEGFSGGAAEQRRLLQMKPLPGLVDSKAPFTVEELADEAVEMGFIQPGTNNPQTVRNLFRALEEDLSPGGKVVSRVSDVDSPDGGLRPDEGIVSEIDEPGTFGTLLQRMRGPGGPFGSAGRERGAVGYDIGSRKLRRKIPPREMANVENRISVRNPTAVNRIYDPLGSDRLSSSIDDLRLSPEHLARAQAHIKKYPQGIGRRLRGRGAPLQGVEEYRDFLTKNILWLYDKAPPVVQRRARLWYGGARSIAQRQADKIGISDHQAIGVLASQSPETDWRVNLKRFYDITHGHDAAMRQDLVIDKDMLRLGKSISAPNAGNKFKGKPEWLAMLKRMQGIPYRDLAGDDQALFMRLYGETRLGRDYHNWTPEGERLDRVLTKDGKGPPARSHWPSIRTIANAINILKNPGREHISALLGEGHKVRSFYNNILMPRAGYGDVTIDTWAGAGSQLRPFSANSLEMGHLFGSKGRLRSKVTGLNGLYPVYADAFRQAAAMRGLLPNEMQSVVWEATRGLFSSRMKSGKSDTFPDGKSGKFLSDINRIWDRYRTGKVNLDETRSAILDRADGIDPPEWVGRHIAKDAPGRSAADAGNVPGAKLRVRTGGGAEPGGGSGDAGTVSLGRRLNILRGQRGAVGPDLGPDPSVKRARATRPLFQTEPGAEAVPTATIKQLAARLINDGVPDEEAVKRAANIRLDKAFNGLENENDIRRLVQEVIDADLPGMKAAARGVRSHELTVEAGRKLGMTEDELLARTRGKAYNAEELHAQAELADAAGLRLFLKLDEAAAGTLMPEQFAQEVMKYTAVLEQVSGARGEAGRALNILKRLRTGEEAAATALHDLFRTGKINGKELQDPAAWAEQLRLLAKENPLDFGKTVKELKKPSLFSKWIEVWKAGLVSGPQTQIINATSPALFNLWRLTEDIGTGIVDLGISKVTRRPQEVFARGSAIEFAGQIGGVLDGLKVAKEVFKSEVSPFLAAKLGAGGEFQVGVVPGKLGRFARLPFRSLEAVDTFYRTIFARGQLHRRAHASAMQQGLQGDEYRQYVNKTIANPPKDMQEASFNEATRRVFREPAPPSVKSVMIMRQKNQVGHLILPFIETPLNVAREGLRRGPFAVLMPSFHKAIKAGGAEASEAMTVMTMGTAVMAMAGVMQQAGMITGAAPSNDEPNGAARREMFYLSGKQPYSINLKFFAEMGGWEDAPDKWVSFGRIEPAGITLGLGADFAALANAYGIDIEDGVATITDWLIDGSKALTRNVGEKTFLRGLSDFVDAMHNPDRYMERYFHNLAAGVVPFSGLMGQAARAIDPTIRRPETFGQALQSRIPGAPNRGRPIRNIWGEPVLTQGFLDSEKYPVGATIERFLSPIRVGVPSREPVSEEVIRLSQVARLNGWDQPVPGSAGKQLREQFPLMGDTKRTITLGHHPLTDEEYESYVTESGATAKAVVQAYMSQPPWQDMGDHARIKQIRKIFSEVRTTYKNKLNMGVFERLPQNKLERLAKELVSKLEKQKATRSPEVSP
jgi:hypothetical protein